MTETLAFVGFGLLLIVLSTLLFRNGRKLKKTGIRAEGIVFDLYSGATNIDGNMGSVSYPIIRFVTNTLEWITEKPSGAVFGGIYKAGQKVTVIYDEQDPKRFIIESKLASVFAYPFLLIGLGLLAFGVYRMLTHHYNYADLLPTV